MTATEKNTQKKCTKGCQSGWLYFPSGSTATKVGGGRQQIFFCLKPCTHTFLSRARSVLAKEVCPTSSRRGSTNHAYKVHRLAVGTSLLQLLLCTFTTLLCSSWLLTILPCLHSSALNYSLVVLQVSQEGREKRTGQRGGRKEERGEEEGKEERGEEKADQCQHRIIAVRWWQPR